jgi:hypothetical protein
MAGELGFEPRAFGFGDRRSNQLSYTPVRRPLLKFAEREGKGKHNPCATSNPTCIQQSTARLLYRRPGAMRAAFQSDSIGNPREPRINVQGVCTAKLEPAGATRPARE